MESVFITIIWYDIIERFVSVSRKLQSSDAEITDASELYRSRVEYLNRMRLNFTLYENKIENIFGTEKYSGDGKKTRKCKPFFDESNTEDHEVSRTIWEHIRIEFFYTAIYALLSKLSNRLKAYEVLERKFSFLTNLRYLQSEEISKKVQNLVTWYPDDLDDMSLDVEC